MGHSIESRSMRRILIATLLLATAGCASGGGGHRPDFRHRPPGGGPGGPGGPGQWGGGPRGRLFVSPMGEPFRGAPGAGAPQDLWFAGADANHDGALTLAEFDADAARWFAVLDRGHDGEIDPEDIDYYESNLLPEIRTGGGGGGMSGGGGMRGGGGHRGGGHGRGGGGGGMPGRGDGPGGGMDGNVGPDSGASSRAPQRDTMGKQGAARFAYLDYPEPVTAADRNFNRGIDAQEFERAADDRFALLDTNGDGRLEQSELPHLSAGPGRGGERQPVPPSGEGPPPGE
jgi:hypothetical protein